MTSENSNISTIATQARILELSRQLADQAATHRKKQKVVLGVGFAVAVIMTCSLSWLSGEIQKLDTDTLVFQGRYELQHSLPEGRKALQTMLTDEAPQLVAQGIESAIASVPSLRLDLVRNLTNSLDEINSTFEAQATEYMTHVIEQSRKDIESVFPNAENKHELIAQAAADEFNRSFRLALDDLHPQYASEVTRITFYIEQIMRADESDLSEDDFNRREFINTLLVLLKRSTEYPI